MLSILVAHSYFLRLDRKQWERARPYPPLATLHVASTLRESGHHVQLFDAMLAEGIDDFRRALEASRPQLVLFYEDSFNFLSKMCLGRMREAGCEMIAMAHRAGVRVLAVGSDATDAPRVYLQAGADVVLLGEGLVALAALVGKLADEPRIDVARLAAGQQGVAFMVDGQVQTLRSPQTLPGPQYRGRPAWDLVDLDSYRAVWRHAHGYFSLNMAASRGCSFRCNWCSKPIWGNQYLQRAPREVAAEMTYLKEIHSPDHIWFADDIFGFRSDWVREFAAALASTNGSLPFTIQTRADLISEEMAAALRSAGCVEAWIGAESGSQRILDAMNKGTTVAEIQRARELLGAAGIRVGFFIQVGYLGEELDDLLATRRLIEQARPDDVGVSVSYPLPGTRFYDTVREQLGRKTHWRESNDLEMMFDGTYRSGFYRAIRDLLHDQVTLQGRDLPFLHERYQEGRNALVRRWQALLEQEASYRNESHGARGCGMSVAPAATARA